MDAKNWILGLIFSTIGGFLGTFLFLCTLKKAISLPDKPNPEKKRVPAWLTGVVERLFFSLLIGLNIAGTPPAMVGWIALKLATNWNSDEWKNLSRRRAFAFSALLAGLISMVFAIIGGSICQGKLWPGVSDVSNMPTSEH